MNKQLVQSIVAGVLLAAVAHAQDGQNMLGRQTQNEGFVAVPATGAVTVDGSLDEWDLSGQIWSYADTSVRDSFSVKTAAMWDADNLYLGFVWRDPMPLNSLIDPKFDAERGWMVDAVQLRVLAGNQPSWITCWGFDHGKQPAVHAYYWAEENRPAGGKMILRSAANAGDSAVGDGVESAYAPAPHGKGFVHELRLPWTIVYNRDWRGAAGQTIRMGMEFIWGSETGKGPIHRYADNMQPGATSREFYWSAKHAWGDLTTVAESVQEPRKYVEGSLKPLGTIAVRAECRPMPPRSAW